MSLTSLKGQKGSKGSNPAPVFGKSSYNPPPMDTFHLGGQYLTPLTLFHFSLFFYPLILYYTSIYSLSPHKKNNNNNNNNNN